ncbi:MAG: AI-2E family transporter [Oscillospiraceae bacterium]|nr:AI-2E family transporter [Oscillospiraceae bacterium]
MKPGKLRDKPWYPYAVAACIAVVLYVVLMNIGVIWSAIGTFIGYFAALILGCVLAYLINPLARVYERSVFKKVPRDMARWTLSVFLAVITVLVLLGALMGMLVPQLVRSTTMLVVNLDGYIASLRSLAEKWGIAQWIDFDAIASFSENLVEHTANLITQNLSRIATYSAVAGRKAVKWAIAVILSVYLMIAKASIKRGAKRLLNALLSKQRVDKTLAFFARCDKILSRYIAFALIDSAIVGAANAIFMAVFRMQYIGLVSVVVAVFNLIPTFGPFIGAFIGAFVLLLVKPWHALAFLIFTVVLQFFDGYIIKPKLFGNTLGVSGLLILSAVVVCGNMFGVVGILLSIPFAAILDFIYRDYFLAALEKRKAKEKPPAPDKNDAKEE